VPLGYQQFTTALSSVQSLTVPAGATAAFLVAEVKDVRWRDDGPDPTSTVGVLLASEPPGNTGVGVPLFYTGNLNKIKFIETASGSILSVSYYKIAG
jgi:hypothetical protein